ncbi:MAG: three component ABC system middle component [Syntrophomonas sp.]
MDAWKNRVPEIANLLNPAFCSSIIYHVILEYQKKAKREFPFTLIYLILPIVLHKSTRERITSRTNMVVWIQRYPDVLIGFPGRAKSLVSFANESIEFLLQRKILQITNSELSVAKTLSKSKIDAISDQEIQECYNKAENLGRWLAQMGAEENIYAAWGVKP